MYQVVHVVRTREDDGCCCFEFSTVKGVDVEREGGWIRGWAQGKNGCRGDKVEGEDGTSVRSSVFLSRGKEKEDETGRRAVDEEIKKICASTQKRSQNRPLCFFCWFSVAPVHKRTQEKRKKRGEVKWGTGDENGRKYHRCAKMRSVIMFLLGGEGIKMWWIHLRSWKGEEKKEGAKGTRRGKGKGQIFFGGRREASGPYSTQKFADRGGSR
jgi:hypothetical protein